VARIPGVSRFHLDRSALLWEIEFVCRAHTYNFYIYILMCRRSRYTKQGASWGCCRVRLSYFDFAGFLDNSGQQALARFHASGLVALLERALSMTGTAFLGLGR
jgi:hypothetical protein